MRLSGPWCKLHLELFDTEELKLIKGMPGSDELIVIWFELVILAAKLGCDGRLLFLRETPYTDEMLAATLARSVPAMRNSISTFIQLRMMERVDGVYAISDWSENQDSRALNAIREGNRERKAAERARKRSCGSRSSKRQAVAAYLAEHPQATNTEVAERTGVSRPTVIKYRSQAVPALPASTDAEGSEGVKNGDEKVYGVKIDTVKVDSFDSKVDVKVDSEIYTGFDSEIYTPNDSETAGTEPVAGESATVKNASRPKNIDDRYKNTSTSTAVADGEGAIDSGIPTREEVRSHFAEMGFAVDPDRFFDVNEGRGWRTNSGKPVDDWKKLAAVWDRNEHPKATTPPARTEPKANAVGKIPSVEEVMAKWGCDRETAQGYIDENMY